MSTPTHPDAQSELKDATEPTSVNLDITGMSCASVSYTHLTLPTTPYV